MATEHEARDLKRAMGQRGRGRPIPARVRDVARAYVQRRRGEGASQETIARELGISQHTVSTWLRSRAREVSGALVPVRVDYAVPTPEAAIVVTTPRGLRIEGLAFDELCTVIARMG
jgi:DNA invertase Pin-like site-specific DNA recombinase